MWLFNTTGKLVVFFRLVEKQFQFQFIASVTHTCPDDCLILYSDILITVIVIEPFATYMFTKTDYFYIILT
jgi:hypothetical protein